MKIHLVKSVTQSIYGLDVLSFCVSFCGLWLGVRKLDEHDGTICKTCIKVATKEEDEYDYR